MNRVIQRHLLSFLAAIDREVEVANAKIGDHRNQCGWEFKQYREKLGYNQIELGLLIGVTGEFICQIEKGVRFITPDIIDNVASLTKKVKGQKIYKRAAKGKNVTYSLVTHSPTKRRPRKNK